MADLEERSIDPAIPRRCEECGATLTADEIERTIDLGRRPLCSVHAAEEVPVGEEEAEFE
jgi:hypothetical protein